MAINLIKQAKAPAELGQFTQLRCLLALYCHTRFGIAPVPVIAISGAGGSAATRSVELTAGIAGEGWLLAWRTSPGRGETPLARPIRAKSPGN